MPQFLAGSGIILDFSAISSGFHDELALNSEDYGGMN
jgi:hypothetical protein